MSILKVYFWIITGKLLLLKPFNLVKTNQTSTTLKHVQTAAFIFHCWGNVQSTYRILKLWFILVLLTVEVRLNTDLKSCFMLLSLYKRCTRRKDLTSKKKKHWRPGQNLSSVTNRDLEVSLFRDYLAPGHFISPPIPLYFGRYFSKLKEQLLNI